jgi:hypothetical protein
MSNPHYITGQIPAGSVLSAQRPLFGVAFALLGGSHAYLGVR